MNSFLSKIGIVSVICVILILLFNNFSLFADDLPRGEIGVGGGGSDDTPRLKSVRKPGMALCNGNTVEVTFYNPVEWVTISIRDTYTNEIVYSEIYSNPQIVFIPLVGYESSCYNLELRTTNEYWYGTFLLN